MPEDDASGPSSKWGLDDLVKTRQQVTKVSNLIELVSS
jgi:hypothetical protein